MIRTRFPVIGILLAVFFSVCILVSCARKRNETAGTVTELRYGVTSEPATLDPLSPSNTADGKSILFNVFEGLVRPDTGGMIQPCIADSLKVDEQRIIYTFRLRDNVKFHDGSVLTSKDVAFSLNTAVAVDLPGFGAVARVETEGDYGIRVVLKSPDPDFLPYLTVGIVKADSTERDKKAVGTGPYYIESYNVQQSLVLKKFDDYWRDGVPYLEKITIVFFADSDAIALGLHGGSVDGALLPGSQAQQLSQTSFDLTPGYSAMVQLLALNNDVAPFNDVLVRQAFNYGIDIRGIIDTAFYGKGEPSGSPLIPGLTQYYDKSLADPYPYNPEKARSLLLEAGQQNLSVEITVPSNFTMHVDTAQVIASQLKKIGVTANIRLVDWATWLSDVYGKRHYQATIISLDSPVVSPRGFLSRYRSDSHDNFINFSNADYDRVYDSIFVTDDEDGRIALYKKAQTIISQNAASVYIQDILGFKAFRAGAYGGILNYPLYVIDFASMHGR